MLRQTKLKRLAAVGILIGIPGLVSCSADEPKPSSVATSAATTTAAPPAAAAPTDLNIEDPAFNRYVDVVMLGRAWDALDASLITDCALQLAEGERVLKRNHKAITSNQVLALAVKVAADKNDAAALDRLAKIGETTKNTAITEQVAAAKKLGGKSRKVTDPAFSISVDDTTPTQLAIFQEAISGAKAAGIAGDALYFKDLELGLDDKTSMLASLTEAQQKHLRQIMRETLDIIPKQTDKPLVETLAKLKSASRSTPFVDPYAEEPAGIYTFTPGQVFGFGSGDPGIGVGGPFIVRDGRPIPPQGGFGGGGTVFGGGGTGFGGGRPFGGTSFGQGGGQPYGGTPFGGQPYGGTSFGQGHGHGGGPGTFGSGSNSPYYPRQNSWALPRTTGPEGYPPSTPQTRHSWSW